MKKLLALVLAMAMVLSMAACGSSAASSAAASSASAPASSAAEEEATPAEEEETAPAEEAAPAEEEAAPAEEAASAEEEAAPAEEAGPNGFAETAIALPLTSEEKVFTYFESFPPPLAVYMDDWNQNSVFQKLAEITGVRIDYQSANAENASELASLMIASGDYTDLIGGFNNYYSNMSQAIEEGIIYDLQDYIPEYAPNMQAMMDAYPEIAKGWRNDEGEIPMMRLSYTEGGDPDFGIYIRQDWLDEIGWTDEIVTYDDWYNVLTALKDAGHSNAMMLPSSGVPSYDYLVQGYGTAGSLATVPFTTVPFYQEDGVVKFGIVEDGFKDYITMLNKWYSEGLIYTDYYSQSGANPDDGLIYGDTIGLWFGDISNFSMWETTGAGENPSFDLTSITDPVQNAGDVTHLGEDTSALGSGTAITTAVSEDDIGLLLQYYDYGFTEEGAMLNQYGIEGESYEIDADGNISYTELITNNPDGMTARFALMKYAASAGTIYLADVGAVELCYSDAEREAAEISGTGKDSAWRLPGTMSMTTDEQDAYNGAINDIITYCQTEINKFIIGENDMSTFDAFVQQIYDLGIETAIASEQAAYDRYLER